MIGVGAACGGTIKNIYNGEDYFCYNRPQGGQYGI